METQYAQVPEDKRDRILEATISEFANKGFDGASTNSITREAGISKGLLFHYFGNKKNLYLNTVDYCVNYFMEYMMDHTGEYNPDILDRALEWTILKLRMFTQHPLMYKLVFSAFLDVPKGLEEDIQQRYLDIFNQGMGMLTQDIDTARFRADIDQTKAIEVLMVALEGLGERYQELLKHEDDRGLGKLDAIIEDFREYVDILRYGLYRQPDDVT